MNLVTLVPLPLPVPHKQTKHGHDDEEQEDDAHDGPRRLALGAPCRANLSVRVELLHHQSCYTENKASGVTQTMHAHLCLSTNALQILRQLGHLSP